MLIFLKKEISNNEAIHFGSHKTTEGIVWCADDWFSTHIKAGIDDNA
jgi:hypothetical protein